jgi:hypothetical protein
MTIRRVDLYAADQAMNAIVGIFVAIGVIVSGIAPQRSRPSA